MNTNRWYWKNDRQTDCSWEGSVMTWRLDSAVADILKKGGGFAGLDRDEALRLLRLPLHSRETYALMETANRMSREQFGAKGENHFHIGVNVAPCPFDCAFCSLSQKAGVFTEAIEFDEKQILDWAEDAEEQSCRRPEPDDHRHFSLGTASGDRPFAENGASNTPLVANTRDITHKEGEALLDAGFVGAYHAVRLGEGRDTPLKRERRIKTIQVLKRRGPALDELHRTGGPGTQSRRDRGPDAAGPRIRGRCTAASCGGSTFPARP